MIFGNFSMFLYTINIISYLIHIYIKINIYIMAATFLPSILVPLVGLVFPAFSMALFFLYTQKDDIA